MKSYYRESIGSHKCSFERYHPLPPTASRSPRLGVCNPPQNCNCYIRTGTAKGTDCKFGRYIHRVHPNTRPWNFGDKGAWAYPGTSQIFWVPLIIRKATNFKFGSCIHSVHANKNPFKIWEERDSGRIQGLPKNFQYSLLSQERVSYELPILYAHS